MLVHFLQLEIYCRDRVIRTHLFCIPAQAEPDPYLFFFKLPKHKNAAI